MLYPVSKPVPTGGRRASGGPSNGTNETNSRSCDSGGAVGGGNFGRSAIVADILYCRACVGSVGRGRSCAPIETMNVRLSYENYSAESTGHEMDAITDAQGHAQFPMQKDSASIARYVRYSARSAMEGVHASFGRHAYVFVFGQDREGEATTGDLVTDWTGTPQEMKSRIVARRRSTLDH